MQEILCDYCADAARLLRSPDEGNRLRSKQGFEMPLAHKSSIGNSNVPGRSYHLDLCHQVSESDSNYPQDRSRESRMEHFGETRTQHWARNRAQGAEPTRRRGCGGQLDQVTGVGSPAQGLVKLEVRLGLGERMRSECRIYGRHQRFARQWRQHILQPTWFRFFQKPKPFPGHAKIPLMFRYGQ